MTSKGLSASLCFWPLYDSHLPDLSGGNCAITIFRSVFLEEIWSIWLLICCIYHRGFHSSVLPWISSGTPAASPWPRTPLSQIWGLARKWNCSDVCHSGPPFSEPRVQQPISLTTLGCDFSIFISSSSWEGKGCIKLSLTNNGLISANILERRRKGSPFFTTIFYDKMFIVR